METPVISAHLATNDELAAQPLMNWLFCSDHAIVDWSSGDFAPCL
jgi:hypothetical protein